MIDVAKLEDLVMDLIEEELEVRENTNANDIKLNLNKFIALKYYTRWKRGILSNKDLEGFLFDIESNLLKQRILS